MKKSDVSGTLLMQIGAMIKQVPDGRKVAIVNGMLHGCKTCYQDKIQLTKLNSMMIKSYSYSSLGPE
jgi:hypothetical protein